MPELSGIAERLARQLREQTCSQCEGKSRVQYTRLCIGIDPGRESGLAIWSPRQKQFLGVYTVDFWSGIDLIWQYVSQSAQSRVVIEDPNLNKPTFVRKLKGEGIEELAKKAHRISRDVGKNQEQARLYYEFVQNLVQPLKRRGRGLELRPYRPHKGSPKWGQKEFTVYTGIQKRVSQHARDAAKLVFGM